MPNTVTNRQMFFILYTALTSVASVDISRVMAQSAGTGGWAAILVAAALFAAAAAMWARLNRQHEGQTVFEYGKELVGKAGAYFKRIGAGSEISSSIEPLNNLFSLSDCDNFIGML